VAFGIFLLSGGALLPLLAQAMHLRIQPFLDEKCYQQAKKIQKKIMEVNKSAAHPLAIRAMQDLFNTNDHRLYHWPTDRNVPSDNNLAKRDTAIAKKAIFGRISDARARPRSVLMSILSTLNKPRGHQPLKLIFKSLLGEIVKKPKVSITSPFPQPKPNLP
jgi:hypothetical protein